MNMKKAFIVSVSALLMAASAFAWSKKTEGEANLGRTYISLGGGASFSKVKSAGESSSKVQGVADAAINVPIFKPGVNALEDVSWIGLDAQLYFNFGGGSLAKFNDESLDVLSYGAGGALIPYLNFETGWEYLQAIKPFAVGKAGYFGAQFGGGLGADVDNLDMFVYSAGGGVEFVITDKLSVTGLWMWNASAKEDVPCYQTVGGEITYWATDMVAVGIFAEHNFGSDNGAYDFLHSDTFGIRFKIGFKR